MAEIKFDIQKIKTEALAAAAPHIKPFQDALRELNEFELKQAKKYKTQLGELSSRKLWTQDEKKHFDSIIEIGSEAAKKLKESMIPIMQKNGVSMETRLSNEAIEAMKKIFNSDKKSGITIIPVEPNGIDIIEQIMQDLTSQALKPKEPEKPKALGPLGSLPEQQLRR